MTHRPPRNDRERLENLVEALSEPAEVDDDGIERALRAELARRGLTLQTWVRAIHRARRRRRRVRIAAAVIAGVCAVAVCGALAVRALGRLPDGVGLEQTARPMTPPDPGRVPPRSR